MPGDPRLRREAELFWHSHPHLLGHHSVYSLARPDGEYAGVAGVCHRGCRLCEGGRKHPHPEPHARDRKLERAILKFGAWSKTVQKLTGRKYRRGGVRA